MSSKTIAVREEVYAFLSNLKLPKESFSDAILRLGEKNSSVMDLAGAWKKRDSHELKEVEDNLKNLRSKFNKMVKN